MTKQALESLPIAVIGGGPVGLAAAAHLVTRGMKGNRDAAVGSRRERFGH